MLEELTRGSNETIAEAQNELVHFKSVATEQKNNHLQIIREFTPQQCSAFHRSTMGLAKIPRREKAVIKVNTINRFTSEVHDVLQYPSLTSVCVVCQSETGAYGRGRVYGDFRRQLNCVLFGCAVYPVCLRHLSICH